jgi:hypothetical protein
MNTARSRLVFERAEMTRQTAPIIGREVLLEGYTGNDADCC